MLASALLLLGASVASAQNVIPSGVPYPNAYYPGFEDPNTDGGAQSFQTSPPYYPSPWADPTTAGSKWQTAYEQAVEFVAQLTLTEKVNLTTGVGWEGDRCVGNNGEIPRLGFRAMCMEDSPLGVRDTDYNSAFPAGVTIAASWDRSAAYQRGRGMGAEHYGKGVDVQLGPVVGPLGRAPEGGRNWEGFSPDPVLSGVLVAETVKGIQDSGVIACTKHYIGNEQEHFRQPGYTGSAEVDISMSANIDDITMHELYLWPFADAVRAGTGSIMCSYNNINNSYACQNSHSLNYLLKGELGFQGFVMSDWSAQHVGVATALAGLDMTMPGDEGFDSGNSYWGANLTAAVLNGSVPQWRIDDMATRIMAAWYYVGRSDSSPQTNFAAWSLETVGPRNFEADANITVINEHVNVQANHAAQIRSQANRGTVLLKNTNNTLPLTGTEKFTGVFGEDAEVNPSGANACGDRGCDVGTMAMGWGSGTANFPFLIGPLSAITKKVIAKGGPDVQSVVDNNNIGQILTVAAQAEVAIVFVNTMAGEGYITVDGNIGDRNNLTLWQGGEDIIGNVTSVCSNVVVVVHSVGPVLLTEWYNNENVTAIVWANVPGEQSGNSIVDILYGNANPGGKLPYTLGATRMDYGTDLLYEPNNGLGSPQVNFAEGIFIDYRAFDKQNITPIYEFGFGLSYTTFTIDTVSVTANGHSTYKPTTGMTKAAPTFGTIGSAADYLFPAGFRQLYNFIYPYLSSTDLATATGDPEYGNPESYPTGATDGSAQPLLPAGGAPGGNPQLYDVLFTVHATVHNTGSRGGDEVVQLYVNRGGPNDPVRELRDFDRVHVNAGGSARVTLQLTRKDLSNWDPNAQDWVMSTYPKTIYVGNSSRNFVYTSVLSTSQATGVVAGVDVVETVATSFASATSL